MTLSTTPTQQWQFDAIQQIKTNWIPHRNLLRAESSIYTTLVTASPGDVIVVVGPSRVGKSSLTQLIGERIVGHPLDTESMLKPFVRISTRNGGQGGKFTTKSFLLSALKTLGHPMLANNSDDFFDLTITRQLDRVKSETLQAAFEDCIRYLKVRYLLVDEVQHLEHIAGGLQNVLPILDGWKTLAEELGIVLVLTGAYPILQVMHQSPHMVGRKSEIHFPRYHANSAGDVEEFSRILVTLDNLIDGGRRSSLIKQNQFLYQGSLGCVGLLNNWIINALRMSSIDGSTRLLNKHITATRRSNADIQSMLSEIEYGEELMRNDRNISSILTTAKPPTQPHTKPKKRGRPFESKLKRFPVGEGSQP